ncbi:MAG: dockerin type I domain-containing protein [Planctomycetota bacterium]
MRLSTLTLTAAACLAASTATASPDFTDWTLVEDPADPNMSAVATATDATLTAGPGGVAAGVDIGYQSVDGNTVAGSTSGFYFDPSSPFELAIDYDLSFVTASGGLGLGFGIGEDGAGVNSAGAAILTDSGSPVPFFGGAARNNNVTIPRVILLGATLSGSMFVSYDAGEVTVGASTTPGAASATASTVFTTTDLSAWTGADLLASFFLRSDTQPPFVNTPWGDGDASAVFSNFRVLAGTPITLAALDGDANGDGSVDLLDFDILAFAFGSPTALGPAGGDFNNDGNVDLLDFDILAGNFGASSPGSVPEPASALLLVAGTLALGRRCRA